MIATISVEAKCKMCGCVIVAKSDTQCPQEWIEKLKPMLTCNKCYDRHQRRRNAEDKLYTGCKLLLFEKLDAEKREKVVRLIRIALHDYGKWLAEHHEEPEYHFSHEVFDLVIEKPDQLFMILKLYRKTVRGIYASKQTQQSSE
jgi:hypothetical protein